jgi:hypothetical protein
MLEEDQAIGTPTGSPTGPTAAKEVDTGEEDIVMEDEGDRTVLAGKPMGMGNGECIE